MGQGLRYTVLSGDNFTKIAAGINAAAGVSSQAIQQANPDAAANGLVVGAVLQVPSSSSASTTALRYTVLAGDSFSALAQNLSACLGVTVSQIQSANPNVVATAMKIGQVLQIPATAEEMTASAPVAQAQPEPVQSDAAAIAGLWYWTWSKSTVPSAQTNLSIAFSGWTDPQTALQNSNGVYSKLPGVKYLGLGGGNSSGAWSQSSLSTVTAAINSGQFAKYKGLAYDVEEGDPGLETAFQQSFTAAKAQGLKLLVTVSHSAPFGVSDAKTLMNSFFTNSDIDILSPQLYTTGSETSNDYATSGGVSWTAYAGAKPAIAPSIVNASMYADAVTQFKTYGVTLSGYIQWQQS